MSNFFFYNLTLLIVLLLNSIPHILLSCFISTSISTSVMRAQLSVQALFPRCLSPSKIADIALQRMMRPIAAIFETLISSRYSQISINTTTYHYSIFLKISPRFESTFIVLNSSTPYCATYNTRTVRATYHLFGGIFATMFPWETGGIHDVSL